MRRNPNSKAAINASVQRSRKRVFEAKTASDVKPTWADKRPGDCPELPLKPPGREPPPEAA